MNPSKRTPKQIIQDADLPSETGVYYFYRDDSLLYIGKSIDIRQRVLSHLYASKTDSKEAKIMNSLNRIEYLIASGELSALLLESREVKDKSPIYNRKLRRQNTLHSWYWQSNNLQSLALKTHQWPPHEGMHQYGIYRSRKQATTALKELCKEQKLCEQRMGLMPVSNRPCFGFQIGHCLGVCAGKETQQCHDQRFYQAAASQGFDEWPFNSPIALQEKPDGQWLILYKWNYLGSYYSLEEAREEMEQEDLLQMANVLTLDDYRIILGFLKQKKFHDFCEL